MKTMLALCERLNRQNPGISAELKDYSLSIHGMYRVDIGKKGYKQVPFYFPNCDEFRDFVRFFHDDEVLFSQEVGK